MGGETGVYNFLVVLPIIPDKVNGQYVWPGTSIPFNPADAGYVGPAAYTVFMIIRNVSLMFFAVVLIIAAICYVTESFRVIAEGTSLSILTGSVFALIMIFIALPLYNTVAALFNELTSPKNNLILGSGMIEGVVKNSIFSGMTGLDVLIQFFGATFFLVLTVAALVSAAILGIMRLFMIGALVSMLPLWIILHAMPPTRRIGEAMIEQIIGLVLASLVSAIILRFGFEVAVVQGFSGLTATIAALATLITAAIMPTILAPRLGGLMMTGALMASHAAATATQSIVGATTGGLAGLAASGGRALAGIYRGEEVGGARATLATMGRGALTGTIQGFTSGLAARPISLAGVAVPSPAAIATGGIRGVETGITAMMDTLKKNAGSTIEHALYTYGITPSPGERGSEGLEWYSSVENSPEDIGRLFAKILPKKVEEDIFRTREDYIKLGNTLKPTLDGMKSKPIMLSRIKNHIEAFAAKTDNEKAEALSALNEGWSNSTKERFQSILGQDFRDPFLEMFDGVTGFYRDVLTRGIPRQYSRSFAYTIYNLALKDYDPSKVTSDMYEQGRMLFERDIFFDNPATGKREVRRDEEVGKWIDDLLHNVDVPERFHARLGHNFKQMAFQLYRENPALYYNLMTNIEKTSKEGGWPDLAPLSQHKEAENVFYEVADKVENIARTFTPPTFVAGGGAPGSTQPPATAAKPEGQVAKRDEMYPQTEPGEFASDRTVPSPPSSERPQAEARHEGSAKRKRGRKFVLNDPKDYKILEEIYGKEEPSGGEDSSGNGASAG